MEYGRLGNHEMTVCPYCDMLFDYQIDCHDGVGDALIVLQHDYIEHLKSAPACKAKADAAPSLMDLFAEMHAAYVDSEAERERHIDTHPDNGRSGFWLVEGIRHDARTKASSAREAIEKCSGVVQPWECPEAHFIGEELPEVF